MNYSIILNASFAIKVHFFVAVLALLVGFYQLVAKKGTKLHKKLGMAWVIMMLIISISSFWIKELTPGSIFFGYSPIHLLSIFTIIQMFLGVYFAKKGNIIWHKRTMTLSYFGGLIIAGAFTFFPGRIMHAVFFLS